MKRFLSALALAALLGVVDVEAASAQSVHATSSAPTIAVLPNSGPHSISLKHELVTFYFKITNLVIDAHFGPTVKNVSGHGHVQMYLDKVPKDATKKMDLNNIVSRCAPTKTGKHKYKVTIEFDNAWVKQNKGSHVLKIGLAKNNLVMYATPVVSFPLKVK